MWLIFIHLVLCIVFIVCKKLSDGKNTFSTVIVVCLPVCGFVLWLAECYVVKSKKNGSKDVGLDKLKVTDEKYRRLETDNSRNTDSMVPLEDALVVNDTMLRRSLMLDILHKNPEEYLGLLEKASSSDDVEITHYATTTLSEIQRDYEAAIQKHMRRYKQDAKDVENLRAYRDCLVKYIKSGLISGVVLTMQQRNLLEVLQVLLKLEKPEKEDIYLYIGTAMDIREYSDAEAVLRVSEKRCREDLEWYQLAVRYYWETGNQKEIKKQLEKIEERNVYLTKEGKKWVAFWSRGQEDEKSNN